MKTILSGIQPTGNVHLGNYLGSIKNWIDLQDENRCLFGIMNLHAITLPQNPQKLRQNVLDAAAIYLACGLDPKKATIFVQSEIAAISEISWILGCLAPMGWLDRMTQFKDKSQNNDSANLGLYAYPVLMAADILTFHADLVPVGQDQKQHLEFCRDLAGAFNRKAENDYFKLPEPVILNNVKRIMSLQDGTKKMSKSDDSDLSRINLMDEAEIIIKKVKKAKTDSDSQIIYDENRPEIYNLLNIFASFSKKSPQEIAKSYENSGYGKFKTDLAEIIVENLRDIQYNIKNLQNDYDFIKKVLEDGNVKANEIANKTKKEIFSLIGF